MAGNAYAGQREKGGRVVTGLLKGIRVADLSIVTAGAGSTQVLADFGADVIKIEGHKSPDLFRAWTAGDEKSTDDLSSPPFRTVNRNKRALGVDLKHPEGRQVMLRLVASSDVVVENFRRGAIERLGLGFDELVAVRKDIVLVSLSSQGATGPNVSFGSFGSTLDALGGVMSITGYDAETPLWSSNRINYPDQTVSLLAPALIVAGVLAARESGESRWIDLSQREVVTSLLGEWILRQSLGHESPVPTSNMGPGSFEWCTRCAGQDDWVAVSLTSDSDWQSCADVVGLRSSLLGDPEARGEILREAVGRWSGPLSREEVAGALQQVGIAAAPVKRGAELLTDPYFTELGWWQSVDLPDGGSEMQRGWAVRFDDGGPTSVTRRAPHVGEHTIGILSELGYDESEVERLVASGAVTVPNELVTPAGPGR